MRERERLVRGTRIGGHSRTKARRYEEGRTCEPCPTQLSVFNPTDRCWQHRAFHKHRVRGA